MEAGHLVSAEATLRRVTTLAPQDAGAWGILGQILAAEHKAAEAKKATTRLRP